MYQIYPLNYFSLIHHSTIQFSSLNRLSFHFFILFWELSWPLSDVNSKMGYVQICFFFSSVIIIIAFGTNFSNYKKMKILFKFCSLPCNHEPQSYIMCVSTIYTHYVCIYILKFKIILYLFLHLNSFCNSFTWNMYKSTISRKSMHKSTRISSVIPSISFP